MQFMEVTVAMFYGPPVVPDLHLDYVNLNKVQTGRKCVSSWEKTWLYFLSDITVSKLKLGGGSIMLYGCFSSTCGKYIDYIYNYSVFWSPK